ncbi:MAG TPA: DUF4148 domain-containing protein [Burkholderiaceae bacterium]|nr:DUF4148 domain-containing protein [Burkholderiaceae bacterium]
MQSRFTLTALALLIGASCAATQAQTREQTRQELADAVRAGTLMRGEIDPRDAMTGAVAHGRSRADVRAELDAAQRNGDMLAAGESGRKLNELNPSRDLRETVLAGKTRAQVLAELAEARRNGDLLVAGESGLTQREVHPRMAPRAAASVVASTSVRAAH